VPGAFVQTGGTHQTGSLTVGFGTYQLSGTGVLNAGSLTVGGIFGSATFTQSGGAPRATVAGTLLVNSNGTLAYDGGTLSAGALVVNGGRLTMANNGNRLLKVGSVGVTSGGTIDLGDNDMQVTGGTTAGQVTGLIAAARAGGAWTGSGITSSAARARADHASTLGILTGAEYHAVAGAAATFDGQPVANADVLVKYTWYGDTDLNGRVNFDDYVRTDNGFNNHLTGWLNGDFDLNGLVNFDDYVLIDLAFNSQSGTLGRALRFLDGSDPSGVGMNDPALRRTRQNVAVFGDDYAQRFLMSVPEPASLALCFIAMQLARRRRARAPAR
jgi:hypothetical protein